MEHPMTGCDSPLTKENKAIEVVSPEGGSNSEGSGSGGHTDISSSPTEKSEDLSESLMLLLSPLDTRGISKKPEADLGFSGINPKKFTVGVELEMIIPFFRELVNDMGDPFELIARSLGPLAKDLRTRCWFQPWDPNLVNCDKSRFEMFQVKSDYSITTNDPIRDTGVEVATPILRGGDWNWVIPRLCEAVKNVAESFGTRVHFNSATGLHIHIAIAGRDFTLPELRRISKAIVLFEEQMSHFHHECRNQPPGHKDCIISCRDSKPLGNLSDEDALTLIDEGKNLDQIIFNMNGVELCGKINGVSRYFKYNFTSLRRYGTIEFRQAMGTDSAEEILDWVQSIIKFVTAAVKTPDYLFVEWARNGVPPVVNYVYGVPKPPKYKRWKRSVVKTVNH